jgi:hypothetical protein
VGHRQANPLHQATRRRQLEPIPADTTLEAMLEGGEIDALMSVMIPEKLGKTIRRLFRDSRKG